MSVIDALIRSDTGFLIEPGGHRSNGPSPLTGSGWTQACCTVAFPAVSKEWTKKSAVRWAQVSNEREVWPWRLHSEHCWRHKRAAREWWLPWREGAPRTVHSCLHLLLREHLFNLFRRRSKATSLVQEALRPSAARCLWVCVCARAHLNKHLKWTLWTTPRNNLNMKEFVLALVSNRIYPDNILI